MKKCKYHKMCKEYQKESPLCTSDKGSWSYGKKARCWLKFYNLNLPKEAVKSQNDKLQ